MNTVQLSDVCAIGNGFAFKSTQFKSKGIPLLKISNIVNERVSFSQKAVYIDESALLNQKDFIVNKGDVVIALSGATTGKYGVYLLDTPCLLNQRIGIIRQTDSEHLSLEYFYFYLSKLKSEILRKAQGAAQPNISTKDIGRFKIPLPPLEEQKNIAMILRAADNLRQKDRQLIEHYTSLSHSLFFEMFGDPVGNPMGWEFKQLKYLSIKIHSGTTPKGGSKVYVDEGVVLLRSQNVWKNKLVLHNAVYIDNDTHNNMSKSSLKNRDILMTKTGRINTENSSLGRAAMFLGEDDSANVNGHVYLIRLQENVLNEFVLFILTTNEYREYIRSVCVGGIDKRQINKDHLEKFPIIYPPVELQKQFVERLQVIETQKQQVQANLGKSEALFNSLLQRAFKGELTISKAA